MGHWEPLFVLVILFSVDAVRSHRGLSCVNDFVSSVSCSWRSPLLDPSVNCSISGVKQIWIRRNGVREQRQIIRTCRLEQYRNSHPGCSFVFEEQLFHPFDVMPRISMKCDGEVVGNISNYRPFHHIKMHPPGVPEVTATANGTLISWSAGSPVSEFIKSFLFHVQIKEESQAWTEAHNLSTHELQVRIPSGGFIGPLHVRVRVVPSRLENPQWSNWSPITCIELPYTSYNIAWPVDPLFLLKLGVLSSLVLILGLTMVLCRRFRIKGLHNKKPVPNPSKYFHTLHSIHKGNLKAWLNPLSASETFFTDQSVDHISPVELCESQSCDMAPSSPTSLTSTTALLHFKSYLSGDFDTSKGHNNFSSSSSSFFSNWGYFLSSSAGSSAQTEPAPTFFICRDDFDDDRLHSPTLPLSLCPPSMASHMYESLKREPQSPDSGFGKDLAEEKEEAVFADGEEGSDDHQTCPYPFGPLLPPSQLYPPSSRPSPPNALSPQVSSDGLLVATPVAPDSGSYAAWPSASAMCRSSSMPVEPCKTGYLTLKELQVTFSNKSI